MERVGATPCHHAVTSGEWADADFEMSRGAAFSKERKGGREEQGKIMVLCEVSHWFLPWKHGAAIPCCYLCEGR